MPTPLQPPPLMIPPPRAGEGREGALHPTCICWDADAAAAPSLDPSPACRGGRVSPAFDLQITFKSSWPSLWRPSTRAAAEGASAFVGGPSVGDLVRGWAGQRVERRARVASSTWMAATRAAM